MKRFKQRKWQLLTAGVLLSACASWNAALPVWAAEYDSGLTGVYDEDKAMLKPDGSTVKLNSGTNTVTYDFKGTDNTFTVVNSDAIGTNTDGSDYNYVYNNIAGDGSVGTLYLRQTNTNRNDFADVTGFSAATGTIVVNSNLDINAYSAYASMGISAGNDANLTINGNVKMRKDDVSNPWGIITKNVHGNIGPGGATSMDPTDVNYTGARWQPTAFTIGYTRGSITVNGDVDVAVRGTAVRTDAYSAKSGVDPYNLATISLLGKSIKIVTPDDEKNEDGSYKEAYYSLASYGGTVNINVKDMQAVEGNSSNIVGNVIALKRSERTDKPDVYQDGRVNIGLVTKDSTWRGVVDNAGATQAGEVNVWLANGATWTHEATSRTDGLDYSHMPAYSKPSYDNFDGVSYINQLNGGSDEEHSGYIYQNSDVKLNIANYSGYNTVIYKHDGNGTTKEQYIGGDTTIKHAASGSGITMATANNGINLDDGNEIAQVLNALASKLTYANYVDGESNLAGKAVIASGLTASAITADVSGLITFDKSTGVGGYLQPEPGEQTTNVLSSTITGTAADKEYIDANIRQNDGSYLFTITPTTVNGKEAAVAAAAKVKINAEDATLNLNGVNGVETNGHDVSINARNLYIKADKTGIAAVGGSVSSPGTTNIEAAEAVTATDKAQVKLGNGSIKGNITSDNATVAINKGGDDKAASVTGNLTVANGGNIDLTVAGLNEGLTGDITGAGSGTIDLTVADGAFWNGGKQDREATLNLTLNGGKWLNTNSGDTDINKLAGGSKTVKTISYVAPGQGNNTEESIAVNGFIQMQEGAGAVNVADYSGSHIVSYAHSGDGTDVANYKGGNFTIGTAAAGSLVIAATDSSGIRTSDKDAVEAAFKALSQKIYYSNAGNDDNLSGKTMIASGLTSASIARWLGNMTFDASKGGVGQYQAGSSVNVSGDYETAIMKGARAAVTSSLLSWRDNAANVIYRGDMLRAHMENDGIWAKTYGGKDNYSANGVDLTNNYWGAQVGYDRLYDNGWIAGVGIDYQKGSSSYSYADDDFGNVSGNDGDNKLYSIGLYASKDLGSGAHMDFAAKAGSVRNEFSVHNGIGTEINGTYRNRAYSATASYGKRFGNDRSYLEPQLQLTWAHLDAKDFSGSTDQGEVLNIKQGSFDSLVGRAGLELGKTGRMGSVYARLGVAHEFAGDIKGAYSAADGGSKATAVSTKDTWAEMSLGATLNIRPNAAAYFDVSRSYGADYEHEWKFSGGLRFALDKLTKEPAGKQEAEALLRDNGTAENAGRANATAPVSGNTTAEAAGNAAATKTVATAPAATVRYADGDSKVTVESDQTVLAADLQDMAFELAPIVVTASRTEQSILKAKADMSVVSREEIEKMHMQSVEEALRTVPGAQFLNYGANGLNANLSGVRLNGSKDVVILVDGVRVNDFKGSGSSGYMFAALMNNMDNVERVEVMRGSAATMYGSGAKGGVINIITRKPTASKTMIDISRGNFGREAYKFNTQGAKKKVSYNIYHDKSMSGSTKDGSGRLWPGQSNTKSSGAKVEYSFNDSNKLTLNYETVGSNYSGTDLIYKGHYVGKYDSDSFTLKHDWQINKEWSNTLLYRTTKEKHSWAKPGGEDPDLIVPITGNLEYKLFSDNFKYQTDRYTMVGGVEYSKGKDNDAHKDVTNTSLFLQGDWEFLPHLTLSAGIRHDRPENFDSHNSISYKLGWDITEKDTLYAGRNDFYIMPSLTQLYDKRFGNDELQASEGRTTTIGYNHQFSPDNYLMLNWFETKTAVGMTMSGTTDKTDPDYGKYQNSYNGVARGWNAQYNARLNDTLTFKLGWSHLFFNEADNFTMGYAPKDKATFGLYYDKDKFGAALDGFYFIRDTKGMKGGVKGWPADKYGVYNLAFNYTADKQTKFYLKVDNIFNKLWAEHTDVIWNGGADSWYAMPGRSFVVGMQYSF